MEALLGLRDRPKLSPEEQAYNECMWRLNEAEGQIALLLNRYQYEVTITASPAHPDMTDATCSLTVRRGVEFEIDRSEP